MHIPRSTAQTNQNSVNYSQIGKNLLNEPEIVKLQRDVDYYTRKLEQEKRWLFYLENSLVFKKHTNKYKKNWTNAKNDT